jgi:hypothetical protein
MGDGNAGTADEMAAARSGGDDSEPRYAEPCAEAAPREARTEVTHRTEVLDSRTEVTDSTTDRDVIHGHISTTIAAFTDLDADL